MGNSCLPCCCDDSKEDHPCLRFKDCLRSVRVESACCNRTTINEKEVIIKHPYQHFEHHKHHHKH